MNYEEKAKEFMEIIPKLKGSPRGEMMQKISQGECHMLVHLHGNGGSIMAGELAKAVGVSTARMTVMLTGTEKKGFTRREMVEGDRRKIKVVLTDAGREMIMAFHEKAMQHTAQYLEALGPEDTEHLLRILHKTAEILKHHE